MLGKLLSDYAEGDIVKLNESGSPVEFYVAKHDYESGLNGTGRTLLVRKDCYDTRAFGSNNAYAISAIDTWLNGTYKVLLDTDVQEAIGATKFYYTPGAGDYTITTLERSVFLLSSWETCGLGDRMEGSQLPISSTLRHAYLEGNEIFWWTRSPSISGSNTAFVVYENAFSFDCTQTQGSRPCFTIQGTAKFDPDTNEFIKVT